jgi:hypothetical protein
LIRIINRSAQKRREETFASLKIELKRWEQIDGYDIYEFDAALANRRARLIDIEEKLLEDTEISEAVKNELGRAVHRLFRNKNATKPENNLKDPKPRMNDLILESQVQTRKIIEGAEYSAKEAIGKNKELNAKIYPTSISAPSLTMIRQEIEDEIGRLEKLDKTAGSSIRKTVPPHLDTAALERAAKEAEDRRTFLAEATAARELLKTATVTTRLTDECGSLFENPRGSSK